MISLYKNVRKKAVRGLEFVVCTAVIGLLLVLLLQIVSRMVKFPLPGTMVWANMLLMWIAFPAACLGLEKKMQLGVDLLYNALAEKYRFFMDIIAGAAIMVFALLAMVYGGGVISAYLWKNADLMRFMFYLPLVISGIFMIFQGAERIIFGIYGIRLGEEEK